MTPVTEPDYLQADGFEEALIGLADVWTDGRRLVAVYDAEKCVAILARSMPWEDAQEYFDFNVQCAYAGPGTPIFVWPTQRVTKTDSPGGGDEK